MRRKAAALGVFCILALLLSSCGMLQGYSAILEANWGFSLPKDAECAEVYEKDAGPDPALVI